MYDQVPRVNEVWGGGMLNGCWTQHPFFFISGSIDRIPDESFSLYYLINADVRSAF